jgi:hypothetical protein
MGIGTGVRNLRHAIAQSDFKKRLLLSIPFMT